MLKSKCFFLYQGLFFRLRPVRMGRKKMQGGGKIVASEKEEKKVWEERETIREILAQMGVLVRRLR